MVRLVLTAVNSSSSGKLDFFQRKLVRNASLCTAVLGLGLIVTQAALAGSGDNWMRDYVRARKQAMLERVLGRDTAAGEVVPPQIVGGKVARPGRWPFQAALVAASEPDNFIAQYCGASVIDSRFILTAAHCVDFVTAADINVLTNTQSLITNGVGGGIRHEVRRMRIHPRWDPRTFDFDVAVLMLKDNVIGIPPDRRAQIIARDDEAILAPPGTRAFVTGWGNMQPGFPTQLHEVRVPLVERSRCNRPASYSGLVTGRMLCAGFAAGGRDACQGDSGGPLVVRNADGKFRTQVGIVSWGIGCALPNFYGVYSRLAVLGPWVQRVIDALSPSVAAAGTAMACEQSHDPSSSACVRLAIVEAKHEMRSYLDMIRRGGSPAQVRAAETAQATWLRLIPRACAFDAARGGPSARDVCIARETRARADTLAGQIAELGRD